MKLLDYPSLLKSFTAELAKELSMRRTVWRVIPGTSHTFGSPEKQKRYNSMRLMEKVFKEMNTRELQTIVERIERKKKDAKPPSTLFHSTVVIILAIALQFLSFQLAAQTVDTISNGILNLQVINEHLDFYSRKEEFEITVAYKENQEASFQFKEKIKKKGIFSTLLNEYGLYKIKVRDDKTPCVFVLIIDYQENTIGKHHFIQCSEPKYPETDKVARTNKKPSRT